MMPPTITCPTFIHLTTEPDRDYAILTLNKANITAFDSHGRPLTVICSVAVCLCSCNYR